MRRTSKSFMKNRFLLDRFLLVILVATLPVQVVSANEEDTSEQAREILEKMASATRNLNYDGVFVYSRGNQLDSMRIIHKVDEEGEVERLISLTGANREVVRGKEDVTCIYSDNQTVLVEKGGANNFLPSNLPESIVRISAYYDFRILGNDRIAGRETTIIEIMPKDEHRYVYRLWIDSETSLMLKSSVVNMQEKTLETVLFTQIDIPHEISNDLITPMNASDYAWHTNEQKLDLINQQESQWKVQWLPNGFSMESIKAQVLSPKQQPMEHLVYSDGLATVSLYIEKTEAGKDPMNGYVSLGAVNAYTIGTEDHQITVVGELPAQTVHKIASSIIQTPSNQKVLQ